MINFAPEARVEGSRWRLRRHRGGMTTHDNEPANAPPPVNYAP